MVTLILTILPMPKILQGFWPEWTALILLYWGLARPDVIGIGHAWSMGILLDVLRNTLLGVHAVALICLVVPLNYFRLRMRVFPIVQQTLIIFLVLSLYHLIIVWGRTLAGHPPESSAHWFSPVITAIFWPLLAVFDHRQIH